MTDTVFLNGRFCKLEEAHISPTDRGFLFADGIYEVIKIYNGKIFTFEDHMTRLNRSLNELKIKLPPTYDFKGIIEILLDKNKAIGKTCGVYIQITRGAFPRSHSFPPEHVQPTVYVTLQPFKDQTKQLKDGIKTTLREDIRWKRCDIKSVALLPNTMLYQEAVEFGAKECILIRDGFISEASHSTVFGIKDGILYTHPLNNLILPGITRIVVLDICQKHNIKVIENAIAEKDFFVMDEIFLSGTGSEIMPVVQVEDKIIEDGKPGPITKLIQNEFFKLTLSW